MITIYTVPGCPKCALLKKKATEYGIEYVESQDVDEVIKAGFHSAPVMKKDESFYTFKDALDILQHLRAS